MINGGNREQANAYLREHWLFATDMVVHGIVIDMTKLPGFGAWADGKLVGLVTYSIAAGVCEIVSLNSDAPGQGIGTELIQRVKKAAKDQGCRTLTVTTTNDNLEALGFYQKRGFDMARFYRGSLEYTRRMKPQLPELGEHGIPLRHEIELEMYLD